MKKYSTITRVLLLVGVALIVTLVAVNMKHQVPFSIPFRKFEIPFFLAFGIAYAAGAVSALIFIRRFKNRKPANTASESEPAAQNDSDIKPAQ